MIAENFRWLLESTEPWARYRTLVDLLDRPEDDPDVQDARNEMLAHPQVKDLIGEAAGWPAYALRRHNDAKHPIYKLSTLADFGVQVGDPGMNAGIQAIMAHRSDQGAFQSLLNFPKVFGGTDEDMWSWVLCDTPTLLYALLAMGMGEDEHVAQAVHHLAGLVDDNGYRCVAAPELGKWRGPGKKADPCPIANVYALKALSQAPAQVDTPTARTAAETLLRHWGIQGEVKYFLFGIGSDFRKLKYPFIWYDILHVTDVLSRFPFVHTDVRFKEMVATITDQVDEHGRYIASSMYMAWKGWSFADKKNPSPWLTFLVERILKRTKFGEE